MNAKERAKLLKVLQGRFERNMERHKGVTRNAMASKRRQTCAASGLPAGLPDPHHDQDV